MSTTPTPAVNSTHAKRKQKTALEQLQEIMGDLVDRAAARMSDKEFKKAEKESSEITSRVRASRRGTK